MFYINKDSIYVARHYSHLSDEKLAAVEDYVLSYSRVKEKILLSDKFFD